MADHRSRPLDPDHTFVALATGHENMQQYQSFPDRILRGEYMPAAVADDLVGLLLRLQTLLARVSIASLGPIELASGDRFADAELALKIVLADVDHLLDLVDHCDVHVSTDRWESATIDLRSLVLTIADHS